MTTLREVVRWELAIFLLLLAGLLATKLLYGEINTTGLLYGRISGRKKGTDEYFSPERVQLLTCTVGVACHYLLLVLNNPTPGTLPNISMTWPGVFGGSSATYLLGKAYARWCAK